MRVYIKEQMELDVLQDVLCDCCGKSCQDEIGMNYEFAEFYARWGYGSKQDRDTWEAHLCEQCAMKIKDYIESLGGGVRVTQYM